MTWKSTYLMPALFFSLTAFASEQCETLRNLVLEMNLISANIANADTTRTPDGGPYNRKSLDCGRGTCKVVSSKNIRLVFNPSHPDANEAGYVKYPAIDKALEKNNLIAVQRRYEYFAAKTNHWESCASAGQILDHKSFP